MCACVHGISISIFIVCVCIHAQVQMRVFEVSCLPSLLSTVDFRQSLLVNLETTDLARLAGHWPSAVSAAPPL